MSIERTSIIVGKGQCKLCPRPDDAKMVLCDGPCQKWFHLVCVHITEKQARKTNPWLCNDCISLRLHVQEKDMLGSLQSLKTRKLLSPSIISTKTASNKSSKSKREMLKQREEILQREEEMLQREKKLLEEKKQLFKEKCEMSDMSDRESNESCLTNTKGIIHRPLVENILLNTSTPEISHRQIAARHSLAKDLPIFSGKPQEWAVFISAYEHSTTTMGLNNYENLLRLQKALKGKAREVVECQLSLPACVPKIIETLRIIFGRPELIIHSQITKIRKCPAVKIDKLETLVEFSVAIQNLCATLEASQLFEYDNNPLLVQELIDKLPTNLKLEWSRNNVNVARSSITAFGEWLNELAICAWKVMPTYDSSVDNFIKDRSTRATNHINVHVQNEQEEKVKCSSVKKMNVVNCPMCKGVCKSLENCKEFNKLTPYKRWRTVKRLNICKRCLKHTWKYQNKCPEPLECGKRNCKLFHHPLLHEDRNSTDEKTEEIPMTVKTQQSHLSSKKNVLFQYIPVVLHNGNKSISTIAFIDSGSDGTFLEEAYAKQLELEGPISTLCIKWTDETQRIEQGSMVLSLKISGAYEDAKEFTIKSVQTVKSLNLPEQTLKYENLCKQFTYVRRLPIKSYKSVRPGMLIGLNNWKVGITQKIREGKDDEPIAVKSRLGWTICANLDGIKDCTVQHCNFHTCETQENQDQELIRMVKHYFSLESLGVQLPKDSTVSKEERRAKDIMKSTTKRVGDRFETGLLWKTDYKNFPNSKLTAIHRQEILDRRLSRNPELKEVMQIQINDYDKKGYIRKLSEVELKESHDRIWYLPIFPVFNPNKPEKVRMVWDAAAKTDGVSLNCMLLKGPDQLASLTGVLHRSRERKIAFTGDIAEMFHQVLMNKEDQHAQRFLWRQDDSKLFDTYVMQVMTFGATCSPSSAQYVKNINAMQFKDEFPKAADAIVNDHYVDDLLTSVDTEYEDVELARQIKKIHTKAGFNIRKWKSNSDNVVRMLEENTSKNKELMNMNMDSKIEKVLGMWWNMNSDTFTYSLKYNKGNEDVLNGKRIPKKREILRILMSVYDPLGLIAHYLTHLKVLLQEVWRSKIEWDESIEDEQMTTWLNWVKLLPSIEKLHIPRCYLKKIKNWQDVEAQIHIFVDASKDACAAVAYIRIKLHEIVECALLGAKTRVASLKLMSIPRLELIAALIGARYSVSLMELLSVEIKRIIYWSDSKTVLSWLQSDAKRIKGQFVAFRIAEIQETTDITNWRFVPSEENVADDATKWLKSPSFEITNRWYQGPSFLLKNEKYWPENIVMPKLHEEFLAVHQTVKPIIDFKRFSDWTRILRTIGYVYRFFARLKSKTKKLPLPQGPLTTEELQQATTALYKLAQAECFPKEISKLSKVESEEKKRLVTVDLTSPIYNWSPIMDSDGVIRVKGRINAANYVDNNFKKPVILERRHHMTKLIVKKYHQMYYHINHETVINELRQRFCIGKLRPLLKLIRFECPKCKITDLKPCRPEMAPLPVARLAAYTRPFTFVGVDYFGPIKVLVGRRTEKRWGCLFTCLTIRAIHIEIAYGLDTESFIFCYRDFINRRGQPREIYCDCGTNFVSADRELRKELKNVNHEKLAEKFTTLETKFIFNPPASPHMGGSWERMVRSVKNTLYAITPPRTPTDSLLKSHLIEVENTVNSRPLTYLPLDCEESEALTPNHFIMGSSSGVKPIGKFSNDAKLLRTNWLMSQLYTRRFWKRWISEYLPTLIRRPKWCAPEKPLEKGDIVIIVDGNHPRNCWPKGRVIEVNKAADGQVRSAKVQTVDGIYKRSAVKLAKLDLHTEEERCIERVQHTGGKRC